MYFSHCITPLVSHIRGHLLQLILPHMVDHTFMAFPIPLQILWTPWTIFVPLVFPRSSLKTCINCHAWLLNLFSRIYVDMTLKPVYIRMCAKGQIVLDFSLMWSRVTCLLAFHMPWDRLNLTFHYPIEALYKEPFGYIEEGGIEEQENYSPLLLELILESASLCPLEHFVFFSSFPFLMSLLLRDGGLKWWRPRWRTPGIILGANFSLVGYFSMFFSQKRFTILHFLKPCFAQFWWGKIFSP